VLSKVRPARVITAQSDNYKVELRTVYESQGSETVINIIDKTKNKSLQTVLRIVLKAPEVLSLLKEVIDVYMEKKHE
jgi:hypothetical protein